ncbi:ADP-ribosylglycohydrolase family protein [Nonomuraea pusilla]|uniref:ADP-ribosylglycohydrolase family protein n=1 Tax=Nonomuraea pusilla TaxID=46177 RepID=UPI00331FF8EE
MSGERATWANRVRGLVLGLALGDGLGRGAAPASGPVLAGVSTQLAAFTIDGVIRAWIRAENRGVCHPPSVVWHAYCRWAALQGIAVHEAHRHWANGAERWPDGWLADVPQLRERRGSAPATVTALKQPRQGSLRRPATRSRGCHALVRSLPLAALYDKVTAPDPADLAREVAALTHGDARAHEATSAAVALAGQCLSAGVLGEPPPGSALLRLPGLAELHGPIRAAFGQAGQAPRRKAVLARIAADASAPSALLGGVYVAASHPAPGDAMEALAFAATAPHGDSVAAVAGALLGALHGVDVWPVDLLSRLELTWVMDTLARDLVSQITESPAGAGYGPPADPSWWHRYPGW